MNEIARKKQAVQNRQIILEEYVIDNDLEPANISKMYLKQIHKVLYGKKKKAKKILSNPEESQSETDEDEEYLENMYISQNYGTDKKDEKHASDLLKKF